MLYESRERGGNPAPISPGGKRWQGAVPFSSDQVIKAVERQGYSIKGGKGKRGSHRTWARPGNPGDRHSTVTIPLNKKPLATGTLASILRQLGIDEATLRDWLK